MCYMQIVIDDDGREIPVSATIVGTPAPAADFVPAVVPMSSEMLRRSAGQYRDAAAPFCRVGSVMSPTADELAFQLAKDEATAARNRAGYSLRTGAK